MSIPTVSAPAQSSQPAPTQTAPLAPPVPTMPAPTPPPAWPAMPPFGQPSPSAPPEPPHRLSADATQPLPAVSAPALGAAQSMVSPQPTAGAPQQPEAVAQPAAAAQPTVTAAQPAAEAAARPAVGAARPEPETSGRQPGWWRRNRWGLVALLPALALALGPSLKEGYEQYSRTEPRRPVVAGADGWVAFSGARIRLVEVVEETTVPGYGNRPFQLPKGVRAWRVTLAFETTDPEALAGCQPQLEDQAGRIFTARPAELSGARMPVVRCTPSDEAAGSTYQTVAYFALPRSATPAAVRIIRLTELPSYARLPVG